MNDQQTTPNPDHYVALCTALSERVDGSEHGFQSLSPGEKHFYAVKVLIGQVHNGGFEQFFGQRSSGLLCAALAGLEALEAFEAREIVVKAAMLAYPGGNFPVKGSDNPFDENSYSEKPHRVFWKKTLSALDQLDGVFYKELEKIEAKLDEYAQEMAGVS